MKKILAIVCAIAVFVSALAGALVFPMASDPAAAQDTVLLPSVSTEGKKIKLYPDTDLTGLGVANSDKIGLTANVTDLPFTSLYTVTGADAITYFDGVEANLYKGAVMYVEIPDIGPVSYNNGTETLTTDQFRFGVTFYGYEAADPSTTIAIYDYMYGGGWYSMAAGSNQWVAEDKEYYGIELEYGFKGYVYIPFASFTAEGHKFTDTMVVKGVALRALKNDESVFNDTTKKVNGGKVTAENPAVFSLPLFVNDDDTDNTPSVKSFVIGGKEYFLDKRDTPYNYPELDVTTSAVSYVGTTDGSAGSNGLRYLKGGQSALTANMGTIIKSHRTYNNDGNAVTAAGRGYFNPAVAYSDIGAGVMVHVDIPKLDGNQTVTFSFYDNEKGTTRWIDTNVGNNTWYLLPDGADTWQEKGDGSWHSNNTVIVGDGTSAFSGYVFMPKNVFNNYSSGIVNLSEIRVGVLPWRYSNKAPNTQEVEISVSAVSIISKFNKNSTLAYSESGALVDLATGDVVRTDYQSAKPFYGYASVNDTNNYLTAHAATINGKVIGELPEGDNAFSGNYGLTAVYADYKAPLTSADLAEVGGIAGPSRGQYVSFEINEVIGETKGVLIYLDTTGKYSLGFMEGITKAEGGTAYEQFGYGSTVRYLADGATSWASTTAATPVNGVSQLPENFKGYVYIPHVGVRNAADKLFRFTVYMAAENADTAVRAYMGNVMLVDNFTEENAGLIKYNGAAETQNMFSGEYFVPVTAETDTGAGEGGEGGETPSYDYSDYKIMNGYLLAPKTDVAVGADASAALRVAEGSTLEVVEGKLGAFDYPSVKLTRDDAAGDVQLTYYTIGDADTEAAKGATAIIYYVELPEGETANISTSLNFWKDDGTTGRYFSNSYNKTFQLLAEGTNTWTSIKATNSYNAELPAGFKGLIRFDFAQLGGPDATSRLYDAYIYIRGLAANKTAYVSFPVMIEEYTDEYEDWYVFADGDTTVAKHFITGAALVPGEGGGETPDPNPGTGGETPDPNPGTGGETPDPNPGTGGETPDPNPGTGGETPDPTPSRPTEEPDYDLPAYTGEKVDYLGNGYGISKVWIAKFNEKVFVGYPFDRTSDKSDVDGGTYEIINSIVNFSNYPSMKVTATAGTATVKHYVDTTKTSGATAAIYYVEAPADKDIRVSFRVNAYKEDGSKAYGNNYSRALYVMTEDNKTWTKITTTEYYATLPAGFKGYVRQDYIDLTQINTVADVSTVTAYYISLIVTDLAADDTFNISAPILIDEISSEKVANAAYIGSDDGCARELFTGLFVKPGDADLGNKTIEPEYKVPAYTGSAIDYGKLDIMNVRTAKLNGSIIIGNPIHDDVLTPAFGTITATESLVGISKYPMFKIDDAEIPAGDAKATLYTAKYDYTENLGAKSVMFYVKLPAGQDSDFGLSWSFTHADGRSTGAYNYSGKSYIMAKGETEWTYVPISKYWTDLPAGFEGYIRYDLKDINCVYAYDEQGRTAYLRDENDELILDKDGKPQKDPDANYYHLDENWGLSLVYAALRNPTEGAKVDAVISSPILIDEFIPLQTIQNIAYVDGDTKAARNIFTGKVVKLGDFDATAGAEPNYDIPFHTGKAENYDKISIMKSRTGRLNDAVIVGKKFSAQALTTGAETEAKAAKSICALTNYPAIELKNLGTGDVNVTMKTSPEANAGATHLMFYVKAPADTETAVRFSFSFTNVKDGRVTGAYNYSGNAYIMGKDDTEWTYVNIDKYYVSLPAGFEGYVRYDMSKIWCVYSYDENGKPRLEYKADGSYKILSDGNHYYLDKDWGLGIAYTYMSGIAKGKVGYISAPIFVDEIDETSQTPRATFHNGEKFARDIFTGAVLKRSDLIKPVQKGDTLKKLPDPTTELKAKLSDKTRLGEGKATITWEETEGASKYVVRVFKNLSGATGLVYNCVNVYEVENGNTVELTGLAKNTRYSVVVYALDADGEEMAIYDYVTVSTVGAKAPSDDEDDTDDSDVAVDDTAKEEMPMFVWIIIGAGAVLLLGGAAVVTTVLVKKNKAKKAGN